MRQRREQPVQFPSGHQLRIGRRMGLVSDFVFVGSATANVTRVGQWGKTYGRDTSGTVQCR